MIYALIFINNNVFSFLISMLLVTQGKYDREWKFRHFMIKEFDDSCVDLLTTHQCSAQLEHASWWYFLEEEWYLD